MFKLIPRLKVMIWIASFILISTFVFPAIGETPSKSVIPDSPCFQEMQIGFSSKSLGAYDLVCVRAKGGLVWISRATITGNSRINSLLPNCKMIKIWSNPIVVGPHFKSQIEKIAVKWFLISGLRPAPKNSEIKIDQVIQAENRYQRIGEHLCSNGTGHPLGVWSGLLPTNAKYGWQVTVQRIKGIPGNDPMFNIIQIGGEFFLRPLS
jgi:hypothetical protein